ncbi:hypothetical protein C8J56DRAFT_886153 [Mycena floridula]|nr:hypothetical protein C8J56DRAFT_886153 [Mycena floridula]
MSSFAQLFPDSVPVVHCLATVPAFLPPIASVSQSLASHQPFLRHSLQELQQSRDSPWRSAYTHHFVARTFEELLGLPPPFDILTALQLDWLTNNVEIYIAGLLTGRYREAMDKINHGFQDVFNTDRIFIFPAGSHALRRGHFIDYLGSILYELCFPFVFEQYGLLQYMSTSHPSYVPPTPSRQPDENFDLQKHLRRIEDITQIPIVDFPINYDDPSLVLLLTNSLQGLQLNRWDKASPQPVNEDGWVEAGSEACPNWGCPEEPAWVSSGVSSFSLDNDWVTDGFF